MILCLDAFRAAAWNRGMPRAAFTVSIIDKKVQKEKGKSKKEQGKSKKEQVTDTG